MRAAFHRIAWKRLPASIRRFALSAITHFVASKPDRDAKPAEPIIVVGCLRSATGLGESARLSYQALEAGGFDVRGVDVSRLLMQPIDLPEYTFRDGRSCLGRGTLLVHVNAPLMPLVLLSLGRRLIVEKWIVGYWAWELSVVPPEWKWGTACVHEIWAPTRFVADAIAARMKNVTIRILPHPVACGVASSSIIRTDRHPRPFTALVVFNMGSSMERKNPLAAIAAFQQAFGNRSDVRLIVKTSNPELFPEGWRRLRAAVASADNITLIDRTLKPHQLAELYAASDCLLSLHRSEGFGLVLAEAMLHGVPVIATNWSGTTDFVTAEIGFPIPCRLIAAHDPQGAYDYPDLLWADPDITVAADVLRMLFAQPTSVREAARNEALRRFGVESYAASVRHFFASANGEAKV